MLDFQSCQGLYIDRKQNKNARYRPGWDEILNTFTIFYPGFVPSALILRKELVTNETGI